MCMYFLTAGHSHWVLCVAWSPDGRFLASGSTDDTVRYWDFETRNVGALEGHTNQVTSVSFSSNSRFLASKATDGTIRFWRTDTWREATILPDPTSGGYWELGLAFHFRAPLIATLGERGRVIRIWEVDYTTLLKAAPVTSSVYYTNAKVVLVGDTGVGKSGLGLVLTGQDFIPTESTHGSVPAVAGRLLKWLMKIRTLVGPANTASSSSRLYTVAVFNLTVRDYPE